MAIVESRNIPITRDTWPLFQSLVWGAVSAEPTAMATALDLLNVKADEVNSTVSKGSASEVLEAVLRRHAPIRNASEVAWALWAALTLGVELSVDAAKQVASVDDDFVALLALDADARGCFPTGVLDGSYWATLVADADAFQSDHWLLAYEGAARGWLASAAQHLKKAPFFAAIQQAGVHFYDPNPSRKPFTGPAAPLPGGLDVYE